ncbi:hypothetical protein S7335_1131 [Synechococcus sp. PCC 7335]|nr:hypothetical protein S7335_1131 [Synechococcus sp. PCC 7335]
MKGFRQNQYPMLQPLQIENIQKPFSGYWFLAVWIAVCYPYS